MPYYNYKSIFNEAIYLLLLLGCIGIFGGTWLQNKIELIIIHPGILFILPAITNIVGAIASVLGSRLCSKLHLGSIRDYKDKNLRNDTNTSLIISILVILSLGFVLFFIHREITVIFLLTSITVSIICTFLTIVAAFVAYKYGLDPDATTSPIITTVSDFLTVIFLLLYVVVVM